MPVYGWVAFAILGTGLVVLLLGGGDGGTLFGVEPAQLAGLTAMLALLVYLGGGMIQPGQQLGTMLRYALVWGALLILLVAGYSFWQRFQ
ncbi:MAG: hypothetical protein AAGH43_05830 [Pseudomonadota bacterium]